MSIVNKLRDYFIILLLISLGLTMWMVVLKSYNLKPIYFDERLINTIIASFYGVTIAVFIYWRQQKDKYKSLRKSLIVYLNVLIEHYRSFRSQSLISKNIEKDYILSINLNIVNEMIISGHFSDITKDLVILQIDINHHFIMVDKYNKNSESSSYESRKVMRNLNEELIERIQSILDII